MKVFICYNHGDEAVEECLRGDLEGRFDLWVDFKRLRIGASLDLEIEDALRRSGALILLWSTKAKASKWVRGELAYFQDLDDEFAQHRIVIPVCLDEEPLPVRCAELLGVKLRDRTFSKENLDAIKVRLMSSAILT